jgi:hypothetical protein
LVSTLAIILTCKLNLALGNDGGGPGLVGHQTQLTEVSTLADLIHLNTGKWETGSRRTKRNKKAELAELAIMRKKMATFNNTRDMKKTSKKTVKGNCCI